MHRSTWIFFVALAGAAGLWASATAMSLAGALTLFVCIGAGVTCVVLSLAEKGDRRPWRRALEVGTAWGAATVAAAGLVVWLGVTGLVLAVALVVFSPMILTALGQRCRRRRRGGEGATCKGRSSWSGVEVTRGGDSPDHKAPSGIDASLLLAPWLDSPPHAMDDATLCLAWRKSYVALQRPVALPSRLRIVDRRRELLDELERRNATGFSAWLASGARAAGDPSKYIVRLERRAPGGDP